MKAKRDLLGTELRVINLGLEVFAESLKVCGVPVVQVDWRPPAGGDPRLVALLRKLEEGGRGPNPG